MFLLPAHYKHIFDSQLSFDSLESINDESCDMYLDDFIQQKYPKGVQPAHF